MKTGFLGILAVMLISACATATNKGLYEAPLKDSGMLSEKPRGEWKIEEIAYEEISNVKPGERPPLSSDEAGIWMLMDQAEGRLKTSGCLVRDENLNGYLRSVLCKLVPEHCEHIRIYLLRVPYFNAAMSPNGAMQIWTGLLLRTENEAQLATIIGHELGHYLRRHSLQRMRDLINKTSSLVFVQLAMALAGIPAGGDIMQMIAIGSIQAFSRDQEREADGYGMALMARAGYDPGEVSRIWQRIIEESKADSKNRHRSVFLATHPADEERYDALKELGERVAARTGTHESGEGSFLEQLLPHRAEYLRDEIHLRNFERTEKLLDLMKGDPERAGELHFFKGELFRLRNKEGDLGKALASYREAAQGKGYPPEMHRSMGLIFQKMGSRQEAVDALRKYLECSPECTDRKMITHMIKEMEK